MKCRSTCCRSGRTPPRTARGTRCESNPVIPVDEPQADSTGEVDERDGGDRPGRRRVAPRDGPGAGTEPVVALAPRGARPASAPRACATAKAQRRAQRRRRRADRAGLRSMPKVPSSSATQISRASARTAVARCAGAPVSRGKQASAEAGGARARRSRRAGRSRQPPAGSDRRRASSGAAAGAMICSSSAIRSSLATAEVDEPAQPPGRPRARRSGRRGRGRGPRRGGPRRPS